MVIENGVYLGWPAALTFRGPFIMSGVRQGVVCLGNCHCLAKGLMHFMWGPQQQKTLCEKDVETAAQPLKLHRDAAFMFPSCMTVCRACMLWQRLGSVMLA